MDKKFDKHLRQFHAEILSRSPEDLAKHEYMYKRILAITYGYLGDGDKSRDLFTYLASIHIFQSPYDIKGFKDTMKKDTDLLISIGQSLAEEGIYLNLAGMDRDLADRHFMWAAENCLLSKEELEAQSINFDTLAQADLWRGYSLLALGKFDEACICLTTVTPLFNKYKMCGGDLQFKMAEYFLPRLLLPLCEYMEDPGTENRKKAIEGIGQFLDGFKYESEKLDSYIYCLHVAWLYPEAYDDHDLISGQVPPKKCRAAGEKSAKKPAVPDSRAGSGTVLVVDRDHHVERIFGSVIDFERYENGILTIGGYPALVRLFEQYRLNEDAEPLPIYGECSRLLATPGLDPRIREETERIWDVAREAAEKGSAIRLYYEEDIPYAGG
jgi:hypothetical protein